MKKKSALRYYFGVPLIMILSTFLIIAGLFIVKLYSMTSNAIPIVTQPTGQDTTPAVETTLETIEGTPTDIDTDYTIDVDDPDKDPIYKVVPINEKIINIVLIGYDARPNESGGRSDSLMLVSYDRDQGSIKLTSFMRDTWVRIQGHDWNRINAAYSFGGVGLAVNTLNDNFNLDVQNYITIRFEQFISVVDLLGGIKINLTTDEIAFINAYNPDTKLDTSPGIKILNGQQTLAHCRNRKVGNGDFDRTRRQREVMLIILQTMKQQRDPITLSKLISSVLNNVQTNMAPNKLFTLALEALGANQLKLEQARVPFDKTWHYANESGRSVIAIDLADNVTKLHDFIYGN